MGQMRILSYNIPRAIFYLLKADYMHMHTYVFSGVTCIEPDPRFREAHKISRLKDPRNASPKITPVLHWGTRDY